MITPFLGLVWVLTAASSGTNGATMDPPSSLLLPRSAPPPQLALPDPALGFDDACRPFIPSKEMWTKMKVDDYLTQYPNLSKMNLAQFAAQLRMNNFQCGIGLTCLAGQICYPLVGKNWMVFTAIQEWNNVGNLVYNAIQTTITLLQTAAAEIVTKFVPPDPPMPGLLGWEVSTLVFGIFSMGAAGLFRFFGPSANVIRDIQAYKSLGLAPSSTSASELYQTARSFAAQGRNDEVQALQHIKDASAMMQNLVVPIQNQVLQRSKSLPAFRVSPQLEKEVSQSLRLAGRTSIRKRALSKPPPNHHLAKRADSEVGNAYNFNYYSVVCSQLSDFESTLLDFHQSTIQVTLQSPVYTDKGLALPLLDGAYAGDIPLEFDVQGKTTALARIMTIGALFRELNYFVLKACDPCDGDGINGAWTGPGVISRCNENKILFYMVRAIGNDIRHNIPNGDALLADYQLTSEYLLKQADDCQQKYGFPQLQNAPFPADKDSLCAFALQVCDCTHPEVHRIRKKRKGTYKACRDGYGLAI